MKRILTSIVIVASVTGAGACTEESNDIGDIVGVEPAEQAFGVRIAGPAFIRENGNYVWHAELQGDVSGADFVWEILPYDNAPDDHRRVVAAPFLEEYIDLGEWSSFEIVLTARTGSQQAVDRTLVTICPYVEEAVDECTARLVQDDWLAFPVRAANLKQKFVR